MLHNPCYDEEKKKDCPGRHAGCAVDCPAWAEYVRQRDAEYAKRREEMAADQVLINGAYKRRTDWHKRGIKQRPRRKK